MTSHISLMECNTESISWVPFLTLVLFGVTVSGAIWRASYVPGASRQTWAYSLLKHLWNVCKEINQLTVIFIFTLNSSQVRKKSTKSLPKTIPRRFISEDFYINAKINRDRRVSLAGVRLLHYLLCHYEPTFFNEFISPEAHSPESVKEKRRRS